MAKIATTQRKETQARSQAGATSGSRNQEQEIASVAYQLFVERGFEHGHDQEDWLRAEAIVKSRKRI